MHQRIANLVITSRKAQLHVAQRFLIRALYSKEHLLVKFLRNALTFINFQVQGYKSISVRKQSPKGVLRKTALASIAISSQAS
jgi:hypothetical protein